MNADETRVRWALFNPEQFRQLSLTMRRFLKASQGFTREEIDGLLAVERAFKELGLPIPEDLYHRALLHILSGKKYTDEEKQWAADELQRRWYYTRDRLTQLTTKK